MTIRYLPGLDREQWYVISTDRPRGDSQSLSVHGPRTKLSVEWKFGGKGFGLGFRLTRNGMESDLGLDLHLGPIMSVWTRISAPWTTGTRVDQARYPKDWFYARDYGVILFPHPGRYLQLELGQRNGCWSKDDPWWREIVLNKTAILGRTKIETQEGGSGATPVPMPEGNYAATWQQKTYISHYVRFPGTLLDRIRGPRQHMVIDLDIEGGIPHAGKGENSWDCGMVGLFGCSGKSVAEAVESVVRFATRDRQRYGPHNPLPRPMTVTEAADWAQSGKR